MNSFKILIFFFITAALGQENTSNIYFPENFLLGAATSSYQIEGGWNVDGKGESIWDRYLHTHPSIVVDNSNGDVACDSYNKWEEDIEIIKSMGFNSYRLSISWPRILPNGMITNINEAGITYYKNIIKRLKANNITPLVTLYHWDLPQALQDIGGHLNSNFVDWFADYARLCFQRFGEDVTYWATFNEVLSFCLIDFGGKLVAPGINAPGIWEYQCAHNVLKAHAAAWHIYDSEFRATQKGKVSMVIVGHWFQPATNSTKDIEAAETQRQFMFGWLANPLFHGDYPDVMKQNIARRSRLQGYSKSRLPEFTQEEKNYIKGTMDYVGLNVYIATVAKHVESPDHTTTGWRADSEVTYKQPDEWEDSGIPRFKVSPWAVRGITNWIKNKYNNPMIIITETGYPDETGELKDEKRISYLKSYLTSAIEAIEYDKVRIKGFMYWTLLDDFEWLSGYTQKFGIVHVDFDDPNRNRTLKDSAKYYATVARTRCLVDKCVNGTVREIDESLPGSSTRIILNKCAFVILIFVSVMINR